jgi:hypothetical protein
MTTQLLRTLDDMALLQLILRDDLPGAVMASYHAEADRRMGKITLAPICDQEVAR